MIEKLIKRFVKNADRTGDMQVRAAYGTLGSVCGIALNVALAVIKMLVGALSGSVSVTADGANNLSDAGGSVVALLSVKLANKPADKKHPFGYGRIEYLGAMAVGVLIIVFGVELLKSGIEGILHPEAPSFTVISVILLVLSVAVKLWMSRFYGEIGARTDNPTMKAASEDSKSDCLATGAVIIGMLLSMCFGWKLDGYFGTAVSLLVLKAGWSVIADTLNRLLGGAPDKELGKNIIKSVLSYEGVLGVHDFVLHDYGPGRCMASIHVEVDASKNVLESHELIDKIEWEVGKALSVPLCIHMDPIVMDDEETNRVKKAVCDYLAALPTPLRAHDFRRVPGEKQTNLLFDVLLPASVKDSEIPDLEKQIKAFAKQLDARHHTILHFDRDYFEDD